MFYRMKIRERKVYFLSSAKTLLLIFFSFLDIEIKYRNKHVEQIQINIQFYVRMYVCRILLVNMNEDYAVQINMYDEV